MNRQSRWSNKKSFRVNKFVPGLEQSFQTLKILMSSAMTYVLTYKHLKVRKCFCSIRFSQMLFTNSCVVGSLAGHSTPFHWNTKNSSHTHKKSVQVSCNRFDSLCVFVYHIYVRIGRYIMANVKWSKPSVMHRLSHG